MDSRVRGNDGGEGGNLSARIGQRRRAKFRKKRRERGNLSVKMDSRFRGNDGGEAGIRRRKSDGGGGDSDLHRNGKSWKLGKKNLPFRRTPESLREIPIYIGMVKKCQGRVGEAGINRGIFNLIKSPNRTAALCFVRPEMGLRGD